MSEKKKTKQKKMEEEKPTKEEYAVARYLRFGLPPREGKLHGMEVHCFIGSAAVDMLLESKWSAAKNAKEPLFTNRVSCVAYMLRLLEKGLFHRAEREKRKKDDKEKTKKKKKEKEEKDETAGEDEVRERKGKKEKKGKKEVVAVADESTDKKGDGEKEKKEEKKDEKKKKRLRLVMPDQQFFEDSDEVFVWIYDPVNAKNFFIGLLIVLGAIALCLFPLWPPEVRIGVYYISVSAAGFIGFILFLAVLRVILFCCIWVLTLNRHHFWLLPNLTEDVGFFDSFKPLYQHDYIPRGNSNNASKEGGTKKKKVKKTEKDSQSESKEKSSDKDDSDEFEVIKKEDLDTNGVEDSKDEGEDGEEENENTDKIDDENRLDDEEDDEDEDEDDEINEDDNGDSGEDNDENTEDIKAKDRKKDN